MTKFGGFGRRRLVKGTSNSKGKTFDQVRSTMDPTDIELLILGPPTTLVPYGTSEKDALAPSLRRNNLQVISRKVPMTRV